jgi:DNA-directed RNA polymerase subunit RPC12/RpoP
LASGQRQFPCGQCGAALEFDPDKSALVCGHCGQSTAVGPPVGEISELDFQSYANGVADQEAADEKLLVQCTACGAQTELAANVTADKCVFCGSPVVANRLSRRLIKAQALLPFAVSRKKAQADFHDWLAGLWFAPSDLMGSAQSGGLSGIYMPFWTFDAQAVTQYTGERGDDYWETEYYTEFVDGRAEQRERQVMRTRWWPVSGVVQNDFDDILVTASSSLPPKQTAHLEPWDLPRLIPYADEYLAGFGAESYQVDLPQGFDRAKKQAEPAIRSTVSGDIGGDHQRIFSLQSEFNEVTFKHILLPLWISAYAYGGHSYRFLINARTGEVQGERPYGAMKIAGLVIGILLLILIGILMAHGRMGQ